MEIREMIDLVVDATMKTLVSISASIKSGLMTFSSNNQEDDFDDSPYERVYSLS